MQRIPAPLIAGGDFYLLTSDQVKNETDLVGKNLTEVLEAFQAGGGGGGGGAREVYGEVRDDGDIDIFQVTREGGTEKLGTLTSGAKGEDGKSLEIMGTVASHSDLPRSLGEDDFNRAYIVENDGRLYIWNGSTFPVSGDGILFRGPPGEKGEKGDKGDKGDDGGRGPRGFKGEQGPPGEDGKGLELRGSVSTYDNLPTSLGEDDSGVSFLTRNDGRLYVWDGSSFPPEGEAPVLRGPAGQAGEQGERGPAGEKGDKGDRGPQGTRGPRGFTGPEGPPGSDFELDGVVDTYDDLPSDLTQENLHEIYLSQDLGQLYVWNGNSFPARGEGVSMRGEPGPKGDPGEDGERGPKGEPGQGIPAGGTEGQVLTKSTNSDYETTWKNGGGGSASWGEIEGTLSNQSDLQEALDAVATDPELYTIDVDAIAGAKESPENSISPVGETWADTLDRPFQFDASKGTGEAPEDTTDGDILWWRQDTGDFVLVAGGGLDEEALAAFLDSYLPLARGRGSGSIIVGGPNERPFATGKNAFAHGRQSAARADFSAAFGKRTSILEEAPFSMALGVETETSRVAQLAHGAAPGDNWLIYQMSSIQETGYTRDATPLSTHRFPEGTSFTVKEGQVYDVTSKVMASNVAGDLCVWNLEYIVRQKHGGSIEVLSVRKTKTHDDVSAWDVDPVANNDTNTVDFIGTGGDEYVTWSVYTDWHEHTLPGPLPATPSVTNAEVSAGQIRFEFQPPLKREDEHRFDGFAKRLVVLRGTSPDDLGSKEQLNSSTVAWTDTGSSNQAHPAPEPGTDYYYQFVHANAHEAWSAPTEVFGPFSVAA